MTLKSRIVICVCVLGVGVVTFVAQTKLAMPKQSVVGPPKMVAPGEFAGEIRAFGGQSCPANWLVADGTELPEAGHASLVAAIGDLWGSTEAGKFKLPDLRGTFLRGWNQGRDGKGSDPEAAGREIPPGAPINPSTKGNQVGTYQNDQFRSHSHSITKTARWGDKFADDIGWGADNGSHPHGGFTFTTDATGGAESRPSNVYVLFCIRDGN